MKGLFEICVQNQKDGYLTPFWGSWIPVLTFCLKNRPLHHLHRLIMMLVAVILHVTVIYSIYGFAFCHVCQG